MEEHRNDPHHCIKADCNEKPTMKMTCAVCVETGTSAENSIVYTCDLHYFNWCLYMAERDVVEHTICGAKVDFNTWLMWWDSARTTEDS